MTESLPIIAGAVIAYTEEQKRDLNLLLTPGPAPVPGERYRDPIRGVSMPTYTRYPQLCPPGGKRVASYHKSVHERSIFEDTQCARSFYVIHPDWTSEAATARRLSMRARGQYAWDHRPAVQPLVNYILPLLERRREKDRLLQDTLREAKSAQEERRAREGAPVDYQTQLSQSLSAIHHRSPHNGTGRAPQGEGYHRNLRDTHRLAAPSRY